MNPRPAAGQPTHRRQRRGARRGEDGQVTAFVVIFLAALFAFAGLVLDGGLTLAARLHAIDEAQAAARAGAQALDTSAYRATATVVLDPAAALTAADGYLRAAGATGQVTVAGDQVRVTVHATQRMQLLDLVGIDQLQVTGTGTAALERAMGAGP